MGKPEVERRLPLGDFRRIVVDEVRRLLVAARLVEEVKAGDGFVKRDAATLIRQTTIKEEIQDIAAVGASAAKDFPGLAKIAGASNSLAAQASSAGDGHHLLAIYEELMVLHGVIADASSRDNFELRPDDDAVHIAARRIGADPEGVPPWALQSDRDDQALLAATANMIASARRDLRALTRDELAAVAGAYRLLDRGVQLPPAYQSIGVYGFRPHQTSLSLANPGEGHISVTCAHADLLGGTIVHVEHIDRDGEPDREKVEPYRLPAALNTARVRLHAGNAAPCTAYVGRPIFEGGVAPRPGTAILAPIAFERDLLKTVHALASACTAMFTNGIADCKIAIERMSFRQAAAFMVAVAGNVIRDPTRQYLSAAFNINLAVWDDRGDTGALITDRFEIGRLGIELAVLGRFDKVTWDGASNVVPSVPIVEQLPAPQWVQLVHEAHERGLETYVSAGMVARHMRDCVFMGVDGVGIGTSLHYRHPQTGAIGQLKPDAIREVLRIRDAAAKEPLGKGARALARLDRMFFEGSLPGTMEAVRQALFAALRDAKADEVGQLLERVDLPVGAPSDEHPLFAQAERMVRSIDQEPVGAERLGADRWAARAAVAGRLLEARDLTGLREVLP